MIRGQHQIPSPPVDAWEKAQREVWNPFCKVNQRQDIRRSLNKVSERHVGHYYHLESLSQASPLNTFEHPVHRSSRNVGRANDTPGLKAVYELLKCLRKWVSLETDHMLVTYWATLTGRLRGSTQPEIRRAITHPECTGPILQHQFGAGLRRSLSISLAARALA